MCSGCDARPVVEAGRHVHPAYLLKKTVMGCEWLEQLVCNAWSGRGSERSRQRDGACIEWQEAHFSAVEAHQCRPVMLNHNAATHSRILFGCINADYKGSLGCLDSRSEQRLNAFRRFPFSLMCECSLVNVPHGELLFIMW